MNCHQGDRVILAYPGNSAHLPRGQSCHIERAVLQGTSDVQIQRVPAPSTSEIPVLSRHWQNTQHQSLKAASVPTVCRACSAFAAISVKAVISWAVLSSLPVSTFPWTLCFELNQATRHAKSQRESYGLCMQHFEGLLNVGLLSTPYPTVSLSGQLNPTHEG